MLPARTRDAGHDSVTLEDVSDADWHVLSFWKILAYPQPLKEFLGGLRSINTAKVVLRASLVL